jgi:hypothetical protein
MILPLQDLAHRTIETDDVVYMMFNQLCHTDEKTGEKIAVGSFELTLIGKDTTTHVFYDKESERAEEHARILEAKK